MIDDYMFPATYPWDHLLDSRIRGTQVVDPERSLDYAGGPNGELARRNRGELIELGTLVGREGDDWQNPNVWAGTGVLVYPSEHSPGLTPNYGVGNADSYADVVLNVRSTSHLAVLNV